MGSLAGEEEVESLGGEEEVESLGGEEEVGSLGGEEEVGSLGGEVEEVASQSLDGDHGEGGDHGDHGDRGDHGDHHDDDVHFVHPSASHDADGHNVPIPGRAEWYQLHSTIHPQRWPLGHWMT